MLSVGLRGRRHPLEVKGNEAKYIGAPHVVNSRIKLI